MLKLVRKFDYALAISNFEKIPFKSTICLEIIMNLYLVDDEIDIAEVLAEALELELEAQVKTFQSLDDCLIALDQNPTPNVIICDVHMPTGSGLRLTSELEKRNLNIPHIFLTGMIDKLPPQKNAHMLRKPAPMEVLIGKIKQIAQI